MSKKTKDRSSIARSPQLRELIELILGRKTDYTNTTQLAGYINLAIQTMQAERLLHQATSERSAELVFHFNGLRKHFEDASPLMEKFRTGWTDKMPVQPGIYELRCDETPEPEFAKIFKGDLGNGSVGLLVTTRDFPSDLLERIHNGLTNPQWRFYAFN